MRRLIFTFAAILGSAGTLSAQAPSNLNDLYVHQWVKAGDGGSIKGVVTEPQATEPQKLEKVKIAIVREGTIVKVAESDANGAFTVAGVEPGSYSLIARGEGTLAAFSLQVLSAESGSHLSNEVDVHCVRPTGDKVKDILRSQIVPPFLTRLVSAATRDIDPIKETRKFADSDLVLADENGDMVGQIGKSAISSQDDLSDMVVFVTSQGAEVTRAKVEKDGSFKLSGLKSGTYGLVAAGQDGFAAVSFQFDNPSVASNVTGSKLVSRKHGCNRLNVEVIKCCDVQCCEQPIETIQCEQVVQCDPVVTCPPVSEVVVDPAATAPAYGMGGWGGGMYGGGGSFGGGGGGGMAGGGIGGLIGIAGLAGVAAIIADNNNDDNFVPVPVVSAP